MTLSSSSSLDTSISSAQPLPSTLSFSDTTYSPSSIGSSQISYPLPASARRHPMVTRS